MKIMTDKKYHDVIESMEKRIASLENLLNFYQGCATESQTLFSYPCIDVDAKDYTEDACFDYIYIVLRGLGMSEGYLYKKMDKECEINENIL